MLMEAEVIDLFRIDFYKIFVINFSCEGRV